LSDQCLQPSFTEGKNSKHYPGIEPSTFGVAVGDETKNSNTQKLIPIAAL
jgi:hypothetical protein